MSELIREKFARLKICVIIPVYRNAGLISGVLDKVLNTVNDVIVVNDGSPDNTLQVLEQYKNRITIISYPKNRGKGKALVEGFKKARQLNFEYAVTMDGDGQHPADDLVIFAEAIEEYPEAIIVGERSLKGKQLTAGSGFANKFSNFWFTVHTLHKLKDTQTGFRLYPLKKITHMKIFTSRYEAELEMLVRLTWRGTTLKSKPINVYYPPKQERVSSFRPGKDFTRISLLNTFFTFAAIIYGYPSMLIRFLIKKISQ